VLGVTATKSPIEALEAQLERNSDVYLGSDTDPELYLAALRSDIQLHRCEPVTVTATVMEPGFPEHAVGTVLSGVCVAERAGYWLVYRPEEDRFYCFWGQDRANLGAHGVSGSPLYCWSA